MRRRGEYVGPERRQCLGNADQTASWQLEIAAAPGGVNCGSAKRERNRDSAGGLSHVLALGKLPMHHKDPFDRLLIAQANAEKTGILSADAIFKQYAVNLLI